MEMIAILNASCVINVLRMKSVILLNFDPLLQRITTAAIEALERGFYSERIHRNNSVIIVTLSASQKFVVCTLFIQEEADGLQRESRRICLSR